MKIISIERKPKFPKYESQGGIEQTLRFILSVFLWIGIMIVFAIGLYTQLFLHNLTSIARRFGFKASRIPFWFGIISVLFLFPFTLFVIGLGLLLAMLDR